MDETTMGTIFATRGGATKEDAMDVVQEAIIKTIECLTQIEATKLRAWLFKVALNRYYS